MNGEGVQEHGRCRAPKSMYEISMYGQEYEFSSEHCNLVHSRAKHGIPLHLPGQVTAASLAPPTVRVRRQDQQYFRYEISYNGYTKA